MIFSPLGDSAVVVTLGEGIDEATALRVRALAAALANPRIEGLIDIVPAYATVTVIYEAGSSRWGETSPYDRVCRLIEERAAADTPGWPGRMTANLGGGRTRVVEIPVCYAGVHAPDLAVVAQHCGLTPAEVVALHSGAEYCVQAVGFMPGFPYLSGLPPKLRTPRRATPRTSVPAGSVGIGWTQTGVYPQVSPGGWQLIGRTPVRLFELGREPAAWLAVGDAVKFRAISEEEFAAWK